MKKIKDMRYSAFIILALVPGFSSAHEFSGAHGTVELDWSLPNVSRVPSAGYGDSFGADAWTRKGFPEPVEVGGRQCMEGTQFLFDIDDACSQSSHCCC